MLVKKPDGIQLEGSESRALYILIFIVSLLAENFDFETVRYQNAGTYLISLAKLSQPLEAIEAELNAVSEVWCHLARHSMVNSPSEGGY